MTPTPTHRSAPTRPARTARRLCQITSSLAGLGLAGALVVAVPATANAHNLPAECTATDRIVTCHYGYTGIAQKFIVPEGVTRVAVVAVGAKGGDQGFENTPGFSAGGTGARVFSGHVPVTAGATYFVEVGGPGGEGYRDSVVGGIIGGGGGGGAGYLPGGTGDGAGGYNGGASGGGPEIDYRGGGGGGASDFRSATTLDSRLVVAAGGGGGSNGSGGPGGNAGTAGGGGDLGGGAGDAKSGGAGGTREGAVTGGAGSQGQGGTGAGLVTAGGNQGSGGGGGGLYGGGGGGITQPAPVNGQAQNHTGAGGGGSSLGDFVGLAAPGEQASVVISYEIPVDGGPGTLPDPTPDPTPDPDPCGLLCELTGSLENLLGR